MNALLPAGLLVAGLVGLPALRGVAAASSAGQVDQTPRPPAVQDDDGARPTTDTAAPKAVTGRVHFVGDVPEGKPLKVSAQQAVGCCPPGENVDSTDRSLLVGEKGGIANVVVTVTVADQKLEVPEEPYTMDQRGCRFEPHVLVVPKGAKVAYLNSDATAHNVHLIALLNDPLNQTVPAGEKLVREAKEAETIKITCDMHTWMNAWVVVTEATHWAITGPDGSFSLTGLPPGEHEVSLWHETLGSRSAKVTVDADGTAAPLEVGMEPKKSKSRRRRR